LHGYETVENPMFIARKTTGGIRLAQRRRTQERPLETGISALSLATAQQDHQTVILVIERSGI